MANFDMVFKNIRHNLISMNIFFTKRSVFLYNYCRIIRGSRSLMFFKIIVLKNFLTCKGKHQCRSLFSINLQACNFIKETPTQVYSCKYYEIFKNTFGGCFKVIIVNTRNTLQSRKFRHNFYISHVLSILSNSQ